MYEPLQSMWTLVEFNSNLINNVFECLLVQQIFAYKNKHRRASKFKSPTTMQESLGRSCRHSATVPMWRTDGYNVVGTSFDTAQSKKRLAEYMESNPTEPSRAEDGEEDALDPDHGYKGEAPLEDDLFLPCEDGSQEFNAAVQTLLEKYALTYDFEERRDFVEKLPCFSSELHRLGPCALLSRFTTHLDTIQKSRTTGQDAIRLTVPFWI